MVVHRQARALSTLALGAGLFCPACTHPEFESNGNSSASASERGDPKPDPGPARPELVPTPERALEPAQAQVVTGPEIEITPEQARAAGLPPLGFRLDIAASSMSGSKLGDGAYLRLSGPPGGPLSLALTPALLGAEFAELAPQAGEGGVTSTVELAGQPRRALGWVSGESQARTAWCLVLIARDGAQNEEPALALRLGVGIGESDGADKSCAIALEHTVLGPIVASFSID